MGNTLPSIYMLSEQEEYWPYYYEISIRFQIFDHYNQDLTTTCQGSILVCDYGCACWELCLYSTIYSYPMFPLQVANPMTIDTGGNMSYGKRTSRVPAEDDQEYTYMSSELSPAAPQPYLCKLTYITVAYSHIDKWSVTSITSCSIYYKYFSSVSHIHSLLYSPSNFFNSETFYWRERSATGSFTRTRLRIRSQHL